MTILDRDAFDALVARLTAAATAYYDTETLLMSDAEYDAGVEQVKATMEVNPGWDSAAAQGLVTQVAAGQSAGGDVKHPTRMLSMAKAADLSDVDALAGQCTGPVTVEPKMDGLAARAVYTDGRIVLAATRGDGSTGEDVTAQVRRGIAGLPAQLPVPWSGEVRGEVFMTVADFEAANTKRVALGGKPFVNPRNATAGCLRKVGDEYAMPMSFAAYDLSADHPLPSSHVARMDVATKVGFTTTQALLVRAGLPHGTVDTAEQARDVIAAIEKARPGLGFDIDGAVVKADTDTDRAALGEGSRTPHWAVAYKYAAEEASSVLREIEVRVGRTGRISLRGVIDPVFVAGATVTYATLHNPAFIAEQGLGVGSKVVVKRAGDVIPRITAALAAPGDDLVEPWTPPQVCPQCGEEWDKSSLLWRCHTPECSVAGRLSYYAARDCMDIDGLGDTVAEALAEAQLATTVADLYDLTLQQWASLPMGTTSTGGTRTLGEANARRIMASLEAQKAQPFNRTITALGIRMTGRSVGRWLASAFPTMDRLRAATVEEIAAIDKLGLIKARHIVDGLAALGPVIDRLAAHGVNMGAEPDPAAAADLPLAGKTYVISGSIPGFTRTQAQERIEQLGGKASSSVSKTTTALVTNETGTSKAKKAQQLGIEVIDPADFVALIS